jgi:Domain of unknown function (DUF4209)
MEKLSKFLEELDKSDWNVNQSVQIINTFQLIKEDAFNSKNTEDAKLAQLELECFSFVKSFDEDKETGKIRGLMPQISGAQKDKEGNEIPMEWPDIKRFGDTEFEYIKNRFYNTKNLFAKSEYGLILYLTKTRRDNNFIEELLLALFNLSKVYLKSSEKEEDKDHNVLNFSHTIKPLVYLSINYRTNDKINKIKNDVLYFVYNTHLQRNLSFAGAFKLIYDITEIILSYLNYFLDSELNLEKSLEKNWEVVNIISNSYKQGAIEIALISNKLSRKVNNQRFDWLRFIAGQYESLANDADEKQNISAVSFVEEALKIYYRIKDNNKIKELESKYKATRNKFELGEIKQEIPTEIIEDIESGIVNAVEKLDEIGIIQVIGLMPMLTTVEKIKEEAFKSNVHHSFISMLPSSVIDKFGNTIAIYSKEEDKTKFSFLRIYDLHLQMASQSLYSFIIKAIRANKLSFNSIETFLNQTWLGEKIIKRYYNRELTIVPINKVIPSIELFFEEFHKWQNNNSYAPKFICIVDSMTVTIEYIMRHFCERLDIATFKSVNRNSYSIMEEKNLNDLLNENSIKNNISDDDLTFTKYILVEKAGRNLRNRVAHGLMDNFEYSFEDICLLLSIIVRISFYKFKSEGINDSI